MAGLASRQKAGQRDLPPAEAVEWSKRAALRPREQPDGPGGAAEAEGQPPVEPPP
jgi:hypothetical protein